MHWVNGSDQLTAAQAELLDRTPPWERFVHAFSLWEVGMLAGGDRLGLRQPFATWLAEATDPTYVRSLPMDVPTALEVSRLPGKLHGDPADRVLAAAARIHRCPLLTSDAKLLAYPHVETIG